MNTVQTILEKLATAQRSDGAFLGSSDTIFGSILIASILGELQEYPIIKDCSLKLVSYIHSQQQNNGSYTYWERGSSQEYLSPYPPDLDDTSLAVAATLSITPEQLDGATIAAFVKLLTNAEAAEGGPYTTWLTDSDDPRWNDIDLGVNANIAYTLKLLGITLDNLEILFDTAIQNCQYQSNYYHLPLFILFFISRSYSGTNAQAAVRYILSLQHDDIWGSPTETALALCALSNFGFDIADFDTAIAFILAAAETDNTDPLYQEYIKDGIVSFYKNRSVSLSFIALAIHRYTKSQQKVSIEQNLSFDQIRQQCLASCPLAFSDAAVHYTDMLLQEPISRNALLLPYFLTGTITNSDSTTVEQIAMAQLYGMIGYNIIDATLDGDSDVGQIPFALYCIHQFSNIYHRLFPNTTFFEEVMTITDQAFAYDYAGILKKDDNGFLIDPLSDHVPISWQKSYGYALPAFALYPLEHHDTVSKYFQAYLHAKQLHDDAHDVIEDLKTGRVTCVGKLVLEWYIKHYPDRKTYIFPEDEDIIRMLFWDDVFPIVFADITASIEQAKNQIPNLPLSNTTLFDAMLSKISDAQQKAALERTRMLQFLKTY